MAKQTKTGGAYSNYQVIKTGDTTGSSKALAQGAADIASTVVQNKKDLNATREKELERFNKAKKTIASQVQARETSKQNALLNAGAAVEGSTLSEKMREDFTEGFKTEVNAIGEAQEVLDNPYASNEAKKEANASIFKAKGLIGNLNLALKKSQEMQVAANANIARIQSYGKDYGYNSIEKAGVQDDGKTFAGWDSAQIGAKGTSMYLSKKDGQYFLGGNGGSTEAGDAWDYETDIGSYNNPTYSTTTNYTPLIPKASQQVVDQMYMKDGDGKSTGKIDPSLIMKNDKGVEVTFLNPDDGIQYTEIDPKTFNANIASSAMTAKAQFDAINNVQDRNNVLLEQLKLTREEGKDLYSDDPKTRGEAMKNLQRGLLEKIRGESLASLNLKEIEGKLYKVSDVQPPKPTVTKPSDKEKDAYYWKNNTTNLYATTRLGAEDSNKRTKASIMPEVLPVQIGSSFQGGKITELEWGADSVTVSFSGSSNADVDPDASATSYAAGQAQSTPSSVILKYSSPKEMTSLAESVGGSLSDPRAARVLAVQIANNNK